MRFFAVLVLLILSFISPVSAESYDIDKNDTVKNSLNDDVRDYFDTNGIDIETDEWVKNITPENVFSHILGVLRGGLKTPLKTGGLVLSIVLISSALGAIGNKESFSAAIYASSISAAGILISPVYLTVSAAIGAIKGCTTFMLSFIPVFAAVATMSGNVTSSLLMSGLLLGAAEGVGIIASFLILPLMSGYLSLGICSSVSPLSSGTQGIDAIKKIAFWALSLVTTVFLGILSIQTAVTASADSITIRTSKFIIGTTVPVAGTAVSEAVSTVTASMGLLKSTVGIYGIIAVAAIFLPILIEILLWRAVMMILNFVSSILSENKISVLFKAVDQMFSFLVGIIILTACVFIISLAVVITIGKVQ